MLFLFSLLLYLLKGEREKEKINFKHELSPCKQGLRHGFSKLLAFLPDDYMNKGFFSSALISDCFITLKPVS